MVISINCLRNAKAKIQNNHLLLKSCCGKNCLTGYPDPNFQQTTPKGKGAMGNPRATSDGHKWGCTKEQTLSCLSPCLQASHWWLNQSFSTIFAKLLYLKQDSDRDDRAKAALAFAIFGRILPRAHRYLSAWWNLVSHVKLKLFLSYLKIFKKNQGLKNFFFYKV